MKVAVCYDPAEELIFEHFGHAEHFRIYDVQGEDVTPGEIVDAEGKGHEAMAAFLKKQDVDCLICGGIGAAARSLLDMIGIRCYAGIKGYADAAVEALARGILAYDPEPTCAEHDHEHSCGEGCGDGCSDDGGCHCSGGCCGS